MSVREAPIMVAHGNKVVHVIAFVPDESRHVKIFKREPDWKANLLTNIAALSFCVDKSFQLNDQSVRGTPKRNLRSG